MARASGASINHLECKIADPLWYRQGRSVGVDHRGCYAVREQPRSAGSECDELVEVHHAKPSQRIGRAVETAAATDPGVDCDGGRDRKSTRLNSSHLGISYAVFC